MREDVKREFEAYLREAGEDAHRLEFFRSLWELQEDIASSLPGWVPPDASRMRDALTSGRPLFSLDCPPISRDAFRRAIDNVGSLALSKHALPQDAEDFLSSTVLSDSLGSVDLGDVLADMDAFASGVAAAAGAGEPVQRAAVDFILAASLTPFVATPARDVLLVLGDVDWSLWSSGHCPVCGTPAAIGRIVDAGELEGDVRNLWCPLCRTEWGYDRIRCVRCGARNPERLHYLFEEGDPAHRVHVCEECSGYIRVTDERELGRPSVPQVEDVVALLMDAVARERGYSPHGFGGKTSAH